MVGGSGHIRCRNEQDDSEAGKTIGSGVGRKSANLGYVPEGPEMRHGNVVDLPRRTTTNDGSGSNR